MSSEQGQGKSKQMFVVNRMDLRDIGINTRNWVDSALDRDCWRALVNAALNLRVPYAMELVNYYYYFTYNLIVGALIPFSPQTE